MLGKRLCSIGGGGRHAVQDYRCSSVSKKSRQHKHDKLWLSRFLTESWNCVIVAGVKNLSGETYNTGEFHCNSHWLGRRRSWHIMEAPPYMKIKHQRDRIYNQSYMHLTVCFFITSSSTVFFFDGKLQADGKDSTDDIFTHKYINKTRTTTFVTEWKVLLLARRRS